MSLATDVLVVGAGLSGLLAASTLAARGLTVQVVDKGRSVGGRLATRRMGPGRADHGAQFFTVRDPAFAALVKQWEAAGHVYTWSHGWSDGSLGQTPPDGHPRYATAEGMNTLAKVLAAEAAHRGVQIAADVKITAVHPTDGGWHAAAEAGQGFAARTLVLTAPVPQSLALLDAGGVALPPVGRAELEKVAYAPCLCLLLWVEGDASLPEPGAVQTPGATVTWVADNRRKGISPAATVLTVHASPDFSRDHYAADDATVQAALLAAAHPWLESAQVRAAEVKRWRYALPTVTYPARYFFAADPAPLYLGGDAFGGPRVEGAALSGLAIGAAVPAPHVPAR